MRTVKRLLAAFIITAVALCATFAAVTAADNASSVSAANPTAGPAMHRSYREASDIVLAECSLRYKTASGNTVSRFTVKNVYDGTFKEGDTFVLSEEAEEGASYLLYLAPGGGADYSEDEAGYVSVTEGLITVEGDTAKCGSSRYSLSSIINDIAAQRSVLAMPAQSFYYNDAASLAAACDDIVLCRVVSVEGPKPTQCRSFVKGESISSTANLLYVTVLVENSFGGERAYGDTMVIALSPALTRSVINAGDLSAISYSSPIKLPQEGEHYIFFLTRSEDAKSDIRFAVNPYQGYVELEGDSVIRPYYNKAIEGVRSLGELAGIINSAIGF